jgi:hypothetical protein
MERNRQYAPGGLMIRHLPQSRRQRMSRLRAAALAAIGVIAVSGIALQELRPVPDQVASAEPSPFDYFPG